MSEKNLILRTPAVTDGTNGTLGLRGLAQARIEGKLCCQDYDFIFHGPSVVEMQTVIGFLAGCLDAHAETEPEIMPIMWGMRSEGIAASQQIDGPSMLEAMEIMYSSPMCRTWGEGFLGQIRGMFEAMSSPAHELTPHGLGFFIPQAIVLVAWAANDFKVLDPGYYTLRPMEGVEFVMDDKGHVKLGVKVLCTLD